MIPSQAAIAEYEEQVSSFLRRASSKAEGIAALNEHAGMLLAHLPSLLPAIKESPAYAGVAFYGRFQAVKPALIKKQATDRAPSSQALNAIREGKGLRVAASAKAGWDLLLKENPDALWAAIYMNLCLAPVTVRVAKARADDEGDSEGGNDDDDNETDEEDADAY